MNRTVDDHSGEFSSAVTTLPIQLSPTAMDVPLCCDAFWSTLSSPGSTSPNAGSVPAAASVRMVSVRTRLARCDVSRHSAKLGQVAQLYEPPPVFGPEVVA